MNYPVFLNHIVRLGANPSKSFHRVKHLLLDYTPERLKFILHFSEKIQLLSPLAGAWNRGRKFDELLKGNLTELWQQFLYCFLNDDSWDELPRVGRLKAIGERPSPSTVRRFILDFIKEGEGLEDISRRLKEERPDFYRKGGNWVLKKEKREPTWEELEKKILEIFLKELHWLSLSEKEDSFLPSTLAKNLLHGNEISLSFEKPVVKPDFEILAPVNTHPKYLYFLERISEAESDQGIYIYRITRKSILTALEKGMNAKEIIKTMEEWGPITSNVKENILRWGARFSRIKLRFATVIEAENPTLFDELKHTEKIGKLIETINSKYAIAKIEDLEKFRNILRELDYYAEVPKEWEGRKILYLTNEEAETLKGILKKSLETLKFPMSVTIEEILNRL